jgi:predicted phage terminase large subunit-like protein
MKQKPRIKPPTEAECRALLAKRNLPDWFRLLNPGYSLPRHQVELMAALTRVANGECKRLIVSMPPRHGKSEITSIAFPSWYLGRNPGKRVMLASYGAALAHKLSRRARNAFALHAPAVFGASVAGDSGSMQAWDVAGHSGGMVAVGVDGPATGGGFDCGYIDDPHKDMAEASSAAHRDSAQEWYRSVFRTRMHPGAAMVVVATRWHEADLIGWLLAEAKTGGDQWEVINLPMVSDSGEPLWPGRYSPEEIEAIRRASGSRTWEALYQGRPSPQDGGIFKRTWWRHWAEKPMCQTVIMSFDLAFKGADTSDFVVGQVWGKTKEDYYLLDSIRGRWDFPATCAAIRELSARWPQATLKLVEDAANGPAVISSLRHEVPGLVGVRPNGGKEARANAVSPLVEAGNVHLPPLSIPWVRDFIDECTAIPSGANDDQVDACTQALLRLRQSVMSMPAMASTGRPRAAM